LNIRANLGTHKELRCKFNYTVGDADMRMRCTSTCRCGVTSWDKDGRGGAEREREGPTGEDWEGGGRVRRGGDREGGEGEGPGEEGGKG
jgi:hypothetical protein